MGFSSTTRDASFTRPFAAARALIGPNRRGAQAR